MRSASSAAVLTAWLGCCAAAWGATSSGIIPETFANRHGLTCAWRCQVQLDGSRARITHLVLYREALYAQTDRAMVHAIDAESGYTLWAKKVGRPEHPSLPLGLGHDLLAVVNGSRLYVCNRYNGDLLLDTQVEGAPGAGPAVSQQRAYVPTVTGLVLAYRLKPMTDPVVELGITPEIAQRQENPAMVEAQRRENLRLQQESVPPLACQSIGKTFVQPVVTMESEGEEYVAWTTGRGYMNVGRIDRRDEKRFTVKYRLETGAEITATPTYLPRFPNINAPWGTIFATSRDGYTYAIQESDGATLWRFSTGEPIRQPAVVIDEELFVATQLGGMFCLDAKTGQQKWWTPQIAQFVAASSARVYASDKRGRLVVLDRKTGAQLDVMELGQASIRMINSQTDRIYLSTDTGLVQCLHELEHPQPIIHGLERLKAAEQPPAATPAQPQPDAAQPSAAAGSKQGAPAAPPPAEANPNERGSLPGGNPPPLPPQNGNPPGNPLGELGGEDPFQ